MKNLILSIKKSMDFHEKSMDFHKKSMKNSQNSNSEGGVPRDD